MHKFAIMFGILGITVSSILGLTAQAQDSKPPQERKEASEQQSKPLIPVVEKESTTEGQIVLNGQTIPYIATAGTYSFKDEHGVTKAQFFYVAYARSDVENPSLRPVTFSFNGGPGAASAWMHMGLLGPKRVVVTNSPPYSYTDNKFSLLDVTDLVFIDPVSTGYSRPSQGEDLNQFHGVEGDVKSIAEFVRLFVTRKSRWESPKYLIGASYGSMRAVKLANYLLDEFYMTFNGIILVSSVLDFQTIDTTDFNNNLSSILFLPSYTATAWNFKTLDPTLQKDFNNTLNLVKDFAMNEYALALMQGDRLTPERRKKVIDKLSLYTGLTPQLIERANLRVQPSVFMKNLLIQENKLLGRFDGRVTGGALEVDSPHAEYDPSFEALLSPFTAIFNQYVRNELKWTVDDEYKLLTNVQPWTYDGANNRYLNTISNLREVMIRMPEFRVFVASGYFDLATPFFGTDYTFNRLNIRPSAANRVTMKYYPGGHMMYVDPHSVESLSKDLHAFYNKIESEESQR
ncbi:MAG: peptidase S10 [Parachlamydiaceae bacterium]|nr:peptidase S10 [Parachlamydiaceae bacterium]